MARFALGIEYDGTAFMGWQRQMHEGRTVQACLESAITKVADHPIEVVCAGRTDAGVHALGQVVHFDTTAQRELRGWLLGINSNLPEDVVAGWIKPVPDEFHARYRARARQYRYTILNRTTRPALMRSRVTWIHQPLDQAAMQDAAKHLLGRHDFSAYRAVECQARSPVRCVHRIEIQRNGEMLNLDIVADGFLHHMVRNIAGVLIEIGLGRHTPAWAREVLEGRDRTLGGVTAPAQGLCFMAALYPDIYEIPCSDAALFDGVPEEDRRETD